MEQNNMKCTGNIGAKQCGRLMRYSMQLIMLQKLLRYKLLSEREYIAVKERLMYVGKGEHRTSDGQLIVL